MYSHLFGIVCSWAREFSVSDNPLAPHCGWGLFCHRATVVVTKNMCKSDQLQPLIWLRITVQEHSAKPYSTIQQQVKWNTKTLSSVFTLFSSQLKWQNLYWCTNKKEEIQTISKGPPKAPCLDTVSSGDGQIFPSRAPPH